MYVLGAACCQQIHLGQIRHSVLSVISVPGVQKNINVQKGFFQIILSHIQLPRLPDRGWVFWFGLIFSL